MSLRYIAQLCAEQHWDFSGIIFILRRYSWEIQDLWHLAERSELYVFLLKKNSCCRYLGGIFFAEALSVIMQRYYFKYTRKRYGEGKRIFKMAPLHHHFEMKGIPEPKIVVEILYCCNNTCNNNISIIEIQIMDIKEIENSSFTILGAGRSGIAVAKLLKRYGAKVFLSDGSVTEQS